MRGVIFVEFVSLLDDLIGIEECEKLIEEANVESEGAYTVVGNYDSNEMHCLVGQLHQKTGLPIEVLHETFGKYLFKKLYDRYQSSLMDFDNTLDLLRRIDDHIHVEVKKLYPNSYLPTFYFEEFPDGKFQLTYRSKRNMPYVAKGLIEGAMAHFNEEFSIEVSHRNNKEKEVDFIIERV